MILKIDYLSGVPTYRQIVDGIKEEIAVGRIASNEELPSVRALATQLKINPNTVARAYRELIGENVVYSRQGMGYYVRPVKAGQADFLEDPARKLAVEARVHNIEKQDLLNFFEKVTGEVYNDPVGKREEK